MNQSHFLEMRKTDEEQVQSNVSFFFFFFSDFKNFFSFLQNKLLNEQYRVENYLILKDI